MLIPLNPFFNIEKGLRSTTRDSTIVETPRGVVSSEDRSLQQPPDFCEIAENLLG